MARLPGRYACPKIRARVFFADSSSQMNVPDLHLVKFVVTHVRALCGHVRASVRVCLRMRVCITHMLARILEGIYTCSDLIVCMYAHTTYAYVNLILHSPVLK